MMLHCSLVLLFLKPSLKVQNSAVICGKEREGAALRTPQAAGKLDAGRVWDRQRPDRLRNAGRGVGLVSLK